MSQSGISLISFRDYFSVETNSSYHYDYKCGNVDEIDALIEQKDFIYIIQPHLEPDIHLHISGFRNRDITVWETMTETGYFSQPKDAIDSLVLRITARGGLSQDVGTKRLACGQNYGLLLPQPASKGMIAQANTHVLSAAFDREALLETWRLLDQVDVSRLPIFVPLANLDVPPLRSFVKMFNFMLAWLQSEPPEKDKLYPLIEEATILQLLTAWPTETPLKPPTYPVSSRALKRSVDFINAHLSEPISAMDVAKASGAGLRALQRSFKQNFGCSPSAYIINQRLDRVHEALQHDEERKYVSQIAYQWGFTHMGDFCRRYRGRYGVTPTQSRC